MRTAEYRAMQAESMSEDQLQEAVINMAKNLGWLVYHTHDSRRSEPGFPDLVLVRHRVLFRELKRTNGRLTKDQEKFLDRLGRADADQGVWRPWDLMNGTIAKELRR